MGKKIIWIFLLLCLSSAFATIPAFLFYEGAGAINRSSGALLNNVTVGASIYSDISCAANIIYSKNATITNGTWQLSITNVSRLMTIGQFYSVRFTVGGEIATIYLEGGGNSADCLAIQRPVDSYDGNLTSVAYQNSAGGWTNNSTATTTNLNVNINLTKNFTANLTKATFPTSTATCAVGTVAQNVSLGLTGLITTQCITDATGSGGGSGNVSSTNASQYRISIFSNGQNITGAANFTYNYSNSRLTNIGTTNLTGQTFLRNTLCSSGQVLTASSTTGLVSCVADAGITGSGASSYLTYWSGANTVTGSADYQVDVGKMSVGTGSIPTATMELYTATSTPITEIRKSIGTTLNEPIVQTYQNDLYSGGASTWENIAEYRTVDWYIYLVKADITAITDKPEYGAYVLYGVFENSAGTLTEIGTQQLIFAQEDTAALDVRLVISGTSILVQILDNGNRGYWHVKYTIQATRRATP